MNEYTAVNSQSRTYDANGNLTDDGTLTYAYDALNRLVEVTDKSSSVTLAEYSYDHKGRRVTRNVDSDLDSTWDEEVRYYYLGGQVVEEQDSSAATQWQYVWGGGLLQASSYSGGLTYVHENGYGSVMATTPESAEGTFGEYDYDGYLAVVRSGGAFDTGLMFRGGGMLYTPEINCYVRSGGAYLNPAFGVFNSRVLVHPAFNSYGGVWFSPRGTNNDKKGQPIGDPPSEDASPFVNAPVPSTPESLAEDDDPDPERTNRNHRAVDFGYFTVWCPTGTGCETFRFVQVVTRDFEGDDRDQVFVDPRRRKRPGNPLRNSPFYYPDADYAARSGTANGRRWINFQDNPLDGAWKNFKWRAELCLVCWPDTTKPVVRTVECITWGWDVDGSFERVVTPYKGAPKKKATKAFVDTVAADRGWTVEQ